MSDLGKLDYAGELERLESLERLLDALSIVGDARDEFRQGGERAIRVLEFAIERRSKLNSPAGFAIARFRAGFEPADEPAERRTYEPVPDPPLTLEDLEGAHAWTTANWPNFRPALDAIEDAIAKERARLESL